MSSTQSESPVREGEIIADKYRVERVLGMGGMGIVVAAMHVELDERVALKFLLPAGAEDPKVSARFAQEARAAAKIKSEHVARILDVGRLPSGSPFMVMEYLEGEDLERKLATTGPLSIDDAVGYVLQASEALAEAHAKGIIHRDLKPANLFLARQPNGTLTVKVLDFGISKVTTSAAGASLTKSSASLGSPYYMSPEQMRSARDADARTDVWGLGVVLYELLGGRAPFSGESMPELIASILQDVPPPLPSLRSDMPALLAKAVMRCLEKDPANRFSSVRELAVALAPFSPSRGSVSLPRIMHVLSDSILPPPPPTSPGLAPRSATAEGVSHDSRVVEPSRRGPWIGVGATLLTFALIGGALVALARHTTGAVSVDTAGPAASAGLAGSASGAPGATVSTPAEPPATGAPSITEPPPSLPQVVAEVAHTMPHAYPASKAPHLAARPIATARNTPGPPPRPAVDCDPPYLIDPINGHHNYKPECMP